MLKSAEVMQLISRGVEWYYESCDYNAAVEYMEKNDHQHYYNSINFKPYVPNDIRNKFIVWRKGKLRSMKFNPDGLISRMYIGRMYKFAKAFSLDDIGVRVKPILSPYDDNMGLIPNGIAVDSMTI